MEDPTAAHVHSSAVENKRGASVAQKRGAVAVGQKYNVPIVHVWVDFFLVAQDACWFMEVAPVAAGPHASAAATEALRFSRAPCAALEMEHPAMTPAAVPRAEGISIVCAIEAQRLLHSAPAARQPRALSAQAFACMQCRTRTLCGSAAAGTSTRCNRPKTAQFWATIIATHNATAAKMLPPRRRLRIDPHRFCLFHQFRRCQKWLQLQRRVCSLLLRVEKGSTRLSRRHSLIHDKPTFSRFCVWVRGGPIAGSAKIWSRLLSVCACARCFLSSRQTGTEHLFQRNLVELFLHGRGKSNTDSPKQAAEEVPRRQ